MTIKVTHNQSALGEAGENYANMVNRYFILRFHPRKMVLEIIGVIWAIYGLLNQNWPAAVFIILVSEGLGLFFTRGVDTELMSQSILGKIGLLEKHPLNFMLNIIGMIILIYGIWMNTTGSMLLGVSMIILGHFFGWSQVSSSLKVN